MTHSFFFLPDVLLPDDDASSAPLLRYTTLQENSSFPDLSLSLAVVLLLLLGCFVSSLRFSTRLVSLCTWYIFDPASVDCMHFNCLILSYLERLLRKAEPLERVIFFWAGWLEFWGVRSLLSFWRLRFGLSGFRHEREKEKNLLVLCVEGSSTSSSARILFSGFFFRRVKMEQQQATFAAGCFWSVELAFQRVPGVIKVKKNHIAEEYKIPSLCT